MHDQGCPWAWLRPECVHNASESTSTECIGRWGERAGMRSGQIGRAVRWGGSVSEREGGPDAPKQGMLTVHTHDIAIEF